MARQRKPRRLRIWAALFAVGVAVGVGGYVAQERIAESRAQDALAKMRERLPANTRFAYAGLDASLIWRSATLTSAVLQRGQNQLRAGELTLADISRTSGGNLRAGRIHARDVSGRHPTGLRLGADRVELNDVRIGPEGNALRSLGRGHVGTLTLNADESELHATDLGLEGATPRRVGRLSAAVVELRGLSGNGKDREVFRDVALQGLDISAVPPPDQWGGLDSAAIARITGDLGYDTLRVGKAEMHRKGTRRLLVRGLESSQERDGDRRTWRTGVDRFRIDKPEQMPRMARALGKDGTVSGRFSGRQVYDTAAGTLALKDMAVELADTGRLAGSVRFTGLPAGVGGFMPARADLAQAKLAALDLTLTDKGGLGPALDGFAAQQGMSRAELVDQRLRGITRKARNAAKPVRDSVEALRRFLKQGGTVRIALEPERGMAMSKVMMALLLRPVRTAEMMNLRIARQ